MNFHFDLKAKRNVTVIGRKEKKLFIALYISLLSCSLL